MVLTELCINSTMYLHFKASWWLIILTAFLYLTAAQSNESIVSPFMFTCFTSPALHKQGFFYETLAIISVPITLSWFATPEPSHPSNICFAHAINDKLSRKEVSGVSTLEFVIESFLNDFMACIFSYFVKSFQDFKLCPLLLTNL